MADRKAQSGFSPVAVDRNWQHRVQTELESSRHWSSNWGFMAKDPSQHDSLDQFTKNAEYKSIIALNQRDSMRKEAEKLASSNDSLDGFLHQYMVRTAGPTMRRMPKQEFQRPMLTSHAIGWGRSLERFGPLSLRMR
mmetsp:Transcript_24365/g.53239  ORF Transcript_24365/g.53239 Transcript_24365/m.53239 type:complete len:137 (+) Transcript_24365:110-520(+)|eukprot:CAMPEP_0202895360 /NCGR_PEP_ID=MMETSP1392-20130828/4586_1 /ASSEMBLY_ACC=CAM_ASM_000868 /TAXON_ID=225041 /ORGANISM="Chlamydomonas chlamydogama, Strain SAG 11-48b" /LENGTH=136 /DNA_ID=CAMNT_0049580347 /DNA_START=178 /DNA_END=588 /DNA_ORIENTATION=+